MLTVLRTFRIYDQNLRRFELAMAALAKRARRIGVEEPTYEVGQAIDVIKDGSVIRRWPVTVSGEAPKYAGWTFVAALTHVATDDGALQTIARAVPGMTVPERFRTASADCDHCGHSRRRSATFVLVSDAGEHKQVGSTCIRDFLGHDAPEDLAAVAELLCEIEEEGEECESWGGGGSRLYTTLCYLTHVSMSMRTGGWISRKKAAEMYEGISTADAAYGSMVRPTTVPNASDEERAAAAIAWAASLTDVSNDYLYNINVVARCTVLPDRSMGLAASIISAYERAMAQEIERKQVAATSAHVGEVGKREVFSVTILSIRELESQFGVTRLHMLADSAGNRFKWFGSGVGIGAVGETVTIKGTVKAHEEYKGVKQTVLSRCSVFAAKEKAPRKVRKAAAAPPEAAVDVSDLPF